ncbi:MAG: alpha/beta hydrolase [Gemmatimonadota bacterium]|nr:alpha/beta hydrolase [Gemmatimonadota bacterium]
MLLSLFLALWFAQERIVFQPPGNFSSVDCEFAKRIEYHASDGQRLVGFLIEPDAAPTGLLICFHGNADLAAWQLEWGREVSRRTGHSVFLAEYRGYYGLGGKPTYLSTALDAEAAYRAGAERSNAGADSISLFGHSLGSAVAVELASRIPARRVLLQAPFTSARAMGRIVIGRPLLFLWDRLSRVHFDTPKIVSSLDIPVAVVHGARDRIVPLRMGEAVYSAARLQGGCLILDDAGHNDIPAVGGKRYWDWLAEALH